MASLTANLEQRGAEVRQVEQQRVQTQQELAKLTEDMAARNSDLAEVNERLQSARQDWPMRAKRGRRYTAACGGTPKPSNSLGKELRVSGLWRP